MESLIQAAEKMFESKQTTNFSPDFIESVHDLKTYSMKSNLNKDSEELQEESSKLIQNSLENVSTSSLLNVDEVNTMFENVYKQLSSENEKLSIGHFAIISKLIKIGVELRRNEEVNKVIDTGLAIVDSLQYSPEDNLAVLKFFEVCAAAFNTTRNLDPAIKLLRKAEQIPGATFSVTLFANVLE